MFRIVTNTTLNIISKMSSSVSSSSSSSSSVAPRSPLVIMDEIISKISSASYSTSTSSSSSFSFPVSTTDICFNPLIPVGHTVYSWYGKVLSPESLQLQLQKFSTN